MVMDVRVYVRSVAVLHRGGTGRRMRRGRRFRRGELALRRSTLLQRKIIIGDHRHDLIVGRRGRRCRAGAPQEALALPGLGGDRHRAVFYNQFGGLGDSPGHAFATRRWCLLLLCRRSARLHIILGKVLRYFQLAHETVRGQQALNNAQLVARYQLLLALGPQQAVAHSPGLLRCATLMDVLMLVLQHLGLVLQLLLGEQLLLAQSTLDQLLVALFPNRGRYSHHIGRHYDSTIRHAAAVPTVMPIPGTNRGVQVGIVAAEVHRRRMAISR